MKKMILKICALAIVAVMSCTLAVSAASFDDISGHWAESVIESWSEKGIILGYEGKFRPDDSIIRGDMAVIMDRVMNYSETGENTFSDLPDDAYYTEAVLKLNKAGIMLGADGYVRPGDNITREEAFVIFNRIYGFENVETVPAFSDMDDVSDWAYDSITALSAAGIVNGSEGRVNPKANITRAEVLQLLENISNAKKSEADATPEPTPDSSFEEDEFDIDEDKKPSSGKNPGKGNSSNSGNSSGDSNDDNEDENTPGTGEGNEDENTPGTGEGNEGENTPGTGEGNEGENTPGTGEDEGGIENIDGPVLGEGEEVGGIW